MTATTFQRKARPTNADLQDQVAEAHDCIHKVGESVEALARVVKADRHDSKNRDQLLEARLAKLEVSTSKSEVSIDLLVKFFGLRASAGGAAPKPRRTLGGLEWWQAVLGIACSVVGSLAGWKYVLVPLGAGLSAAAQAFLHLH